MQQDMSIKEAGSLFARAARGGGYSWGVSEEVGYAVAWLAKTGLLDAKLQKNITDYFAGDTAACDLIQQGEVWSSASGKALCPLSIGCYLADLSADGAVFNRKFLSLKAITLPALILPFIARVTRERSIEVELSWQAGRIGVRCGNLLSPIETACIQDVCSLTAQTLTIHLEPEMQFYTDSLAKQSRVILSQQQYAALSELAMKTHVPETEALQLSGAG